MDNLVLTGFMGTGKTAVGREVARRLNRPFIDMDTEIEVRSGKPISRIFEEDGEPAFREMESALCRELGARSGLVVATGGGALVSPVNRAAWARSSTIVCLRADVDEILRRIGEAEDRPLLSGPERRDDAERLLSAREESYASIPWQLNTKGRSLSEVAEAVANLAHVRTLSVSYPGGTYDIHIGRDTLGYLGGAIRAAGILIGTRFAIVSNDVLAPLYAGPVSDALAAAGFPSFVCALPDGEDYKTPETVRGLYDQLLEGDLDRSGTILALGGGVTGDIAGFAAATFMRGVRFVQVPTSLLAMTDASVGAKTGVDLPQGKNLVGAFKQPEVVFVDLEVLETLPEVELRSGMAEVIKHGVIGDALLYEELAAAVRRQDAMRITPGMLARSIQVKLDIVQEDPFERGRRAVLNLGHTAGHALEQLSHYEMRHGEAVSIGMVVAARISESLGRAVPHLSDGIAATLRSEGLPITCPPWPVDEIWAAMRHDKKRQGAGLRWILPYEIGRAEIVRDVPEELVRSVLVELGARAGD